LTSRFHSTTTLFQRHHADWCYTSKPLGRSLFQRYERALGTANFAASGESDQPVNSQRTLVHWAAVDVETNRNAGFAAPPQCIWWLAATTIKAPSTMLEAHTEAGENEMEITMIAHSAGLVSNSYTGGTVWPDACAS
jgi:hypothetical protein